MSMVISPLNLYERVRSGKKVNGTSLAHPPLFILGHWRSGTTYLHNLITQDQRFGYPATYQTVVPGLTLSFESFIKPIVASSLPPTRPQDNIALGADLPQEEEYAMGNLSPYSFYNGWVFPKNMRRYYNYVCMEDVPPHAVAEWKKVYTYYLKKVSLYWGGRPLVLKNPANTARIRLLLDLFPEAKFVHIYRNPYHTFLSMQRMTRCEMSLYCVQNPPDDEYIERANAALYNALFKRYFEQKDLVPAGNLCEVRYEDLVAEPLATVRGIYAALDLPDFRVCERSLQDYIKTQRRIRAHTYEIDPALKKRLYGYLKLTVDRWGYDV
jgi:hypothetical protein